MSDASATGSPAARAASRARTLLPTRRSTSGDGPTKVMSASAHAAASRGSSDMKP